MKQLSVIGLDKKKAEQLGLEPLAYFRGFSVVGCEPDEMGIGPIYAIPKLLESAGLSQDDVDLWELNEAFASQVVYIRDYLGLPSDILNVNGGSIAHTIKVGLHMAWIPAILYLGAQHPVNGVKISIGDLLGAVA